MPSTVRPSILITSEASFSMKRQAKHGRLCDNTKAIIALVLWCVAPILSFRTTVNVERGRSPCLHAARKPDDGLSLSNTPTIPANFSADFLATSTPIVQPVTSLLFEAAKVVKDAAVKATLTPVHEYVKSKERVDMAIKAEEEQATEEKSRENMVEMIPQPIRSAQEGLRRAVEVPGEMLDGVVEAVEEVATLPAQLKREVQEIAAVAQNAMDTIASTPQRVQEVAEMAAAVPRKIDQGLNETAALFNDARKTIQALPVETRRLVKTVENEIQEAAQVGESLPSRIENLMEGASQRLRDGFRDVRKAGARSGIDLAQTAAEAGITMAEPLLRSALLPLYKYRRSSLRVGAAVEEERRMLPSPRPGTVQEMEVEAPPSSPESSLNNTGKIEEESEKEGVPTGDTDFDEEVVTKPSGEEEAKKTNHTRKRMGSLRRRWGALISSRGRKKQSRPLTSAVALAPTSLAVKSDVKENENTTPGESDIGGSNVMTEAVVDKSPAPAIVAEVTSDQAVGKSTPISRGSKMLAEVVGQEGGELEEFLIVEEDQPVPERGADVTGTATSDMTASAVVASTVTPLSAAPELASAATFAPRTTSATRSSSAWKRRPWQPSKTPAVAQQSRYMLEQAVGRPATVLPSVAAVNTSAATATNRGSAINSATDTSPTTFINPTPDTQLVTQPAIVADPINASTPHTVRSALTVSDLIATKPDTLINTTFTDPSTNVVINDIDTTSTAVLPSPEATSETGPAISIATSQVAPSPPAVPLVLPPPTAQQSRATEFLQDWVASAVPEKKKLLLEKTAIKWKRQWYPVAVLANLPRRRGRSNTVTTFKILGTEYALRKFPGTSRSAAMKHGWHCSEVGDSMATGDNGMGDSRGSPPPTSLPLIEHEGLLWAWPDTSIEGLATGALLQPPQGDVGLEGAGVDRATATPPRGFLGVALLRRWFQQRKQMQKENRGWREPEYVERELRCDYGEVVQAVLAQVQGATAFGLGGGGEDTVGDWDGVVRRSRVAVTRTDGTGLEATIESNGLPPVCASFIFPAVIKWLLLPVRPTPFQFDNASTIYNPATTGPRNMSFQAPSSMFKGERSRGKRVRRVTSSLLKGMGLLGDKGMPKGSQVNTRNGGNAQGQGLGKGEGIEYTLFVLPSSPGHTKVFATMNDRNRFEVSLPWVKQAQKVQLEQLLDSLAQSTAGGCPTHPAPGTLPASVQRWLEGRARGGPVWIRPSPVDSSNSV